MATLIKAWPLIFNRNLKPLFPGDNSLNRIDYRRSV